MTEDALNRLGIFLNFLAGFLLAPQLIGEHRIRRAELWTEDMSKRVLERVTEHLHEIKKSGPLSILQPYLTVLAMYGVFFVFSRVIEMPFWAALLVTALVAGIYYLLIAIVVGLSILFEWLGSASRLAKMNRFDLFRSSNLVTGAYIPMGALLFTWPWDTLIACDGDLREWPLAILFDLASPALCIVVLALWGVSRCIRTLLEGEDRLLGILTALGVLAFTVGNALQFVATFHPGR